MITPTFSLSQSVSSIILKIRLPYVKISSAETNVESKKITFFLQPYFLSLIFQNELKPNGVNSAIYDHNTSYLTITVDKKNTEEHFQDLDLITALLQPIKIKHKNIGVNIEVISEDKELDNLEDNSEQIFSELISDFKIIGFGNMSYGFNKKYSKVFNDLKVN